TKIREAIERRIKGAGLGELVERVLVPTETVSEIKGGKRKVSRRKIFPGYLVLHMEMTDDVWYTIRDTPGVGDFLGAHGQPTLMEPHEVEKLLGDMETGAEKPKLKIEFQKGDNVKVKEGPFENFEGIVDEVNPTKGIVKVIVTIFGRPTPVDLEYWQVEPV
ncbi:MAG: transcription termination/antitermination protein NusG, partial [Planctomycetota bacterium]